MTSVQAEYSNKSRITEYRIYVALFIITAAGFIFRLQGLDLVSMSHPEIYVPGIQLVPGISEPPPRHDLVFTLWWHFHKEPHPIGWYLAMFGWTEIFGTSEFALRIPSAILGTLTIPLVFWVGRRTFGPTAGLVAAAMIAMHGFHAEWSQIARMYVPAAFLSILSMVFAIKILEAQRTYYWLELGYVLVLIAGIQTTELYWGILAMHVVWLLLLQAPNQPVDVINWRGNVVTAIGRLSQLLSLAFMVSAISLLHSVYRARSGAGGDASRQFMIDYLSFGFLFEVPGDLPDKIVFPILMIIGVVLLVLVALAAAFRTSDAETFENPMRGSVPVRLRVLVMVVSTAIAVWLATIAHFRGAILLVIATAPFMALWLPQIIVLGRQILTRFFSEIYRVSAYLGPARLFVGLIALAAPIGFFVVSFKLSVLASRAFLVFLPALLILISGGVVYLCRNGVLRWVLPLVLIPIFVGGMLYREASPYLPRDYKAIALLMKTEMQSDDLVFVRDKNWKDTPVFYYLPDANYVTNGYEQAITANPEKRIWLISWADEAPETAPGSRGAALKRHVSELEFTGAQARAELFVHPDHR